MYAHSVARCWCCPRGADDDGEPPKRRAAIKGFFNPPTDAQVNCLTNNFKIYIKIDIKTAPTCFGVTTIIRERIIRSC
jgi:hypothetical protein